MLADQSQPDSPQLLRSIRNPLLKEVRKAVARGGLTAGGLCVAESFHLLEEALRSNCRIEHVVAADSVYKTVERHVQGLRRVPVIRVPDDVFDQISSTETSQGVLTLVKPPTWDMEHLFRAQSLVIVVDGVQDPGNMGAIVRASEAFSATGVLALKGTVSPYNPKALRASAGSIFRMPLATGVDEALACAALEQRRIDVYTAMPSKGKVLSEVDLTRRCALIIGGEGRGVSNRLRSMAEDLTIPTAQVESLNASIAAAVLLYEARRQRLIRA